MGIQNKTGFHTSMEAETLVISTSNLKKETLKKSYGLRPKEGVKD